jgi:predicted adenylyl cyclase CyaB
MAVNIEIKTRVADVVSLREAVRARAEEGPEVLVQEDTFFRVEKGRLKLRIVEGAAAELIYYEREDAPGPVPSTYLISSVNEPKELKDILSASLGVRGVVRKERELFFLGRTRVHLDQVEGLGSFVELEVVLEPKESVEAGRSEALAILRELSVASEDRVKVAYIDLVESRTE